MLCLNNAYGVSYAFDINAEITENSAYQFVAWNATMHGLIGGGMTALLLLMAAVSQAYGWSIPSRCTAGLSRSSW